MKERDGEGEAVPTEGKTMRHKKKKTAVGRKGKKKRYKTPEPVDL